MEVVEDGIKNHVTSEAAISRDLYIIRPHGPIYMDVLQPTTGLACVQECMHHHSEVA